MCRGLFRVATTRNVGQDLATFGDVGDTSATCGAKLRGRVRVEQNFYLRRFKDSLRQCAHQLRRITRRNWTPVKIRKAILK